MTDADFLKWVAARLIFVYGESPNVDFVLKLEELAKSLEFKYSSGTMDDCRPY